MIDKTHQQPDGPISDDKLSAFLDAELPDHEMQWIRDQIADNEELAMRIAELASVDAIVSSTYHEIDEVPLPDSIQELVAASQSTSSDPANTGKVVPLSLWQRAQSVWQAHAPLATAAALVLGLMIGVSSSYLNTDSSRFATNYTVHQWPQVKTILNDKPSGEAVTLTQGYTLMPRVSFINGQQQLCRQFVVNTPINSQHNIACHDGQQWQLEATLYDEPIETGNYQTASSQQPINSLVDSMAVGAFLNPEQEQEAIRSGWAQSSNH